MGNKRGWSNFVNGVSRKVHPMGVMKQTYRDRFKSILRSGEGKIKDYPHESHPIGDEFAHYSDDKNSKRIRYDGQDGRDEVKSEDPNNFLLYFLYFLIQIYNRLVK
jgi:hypothetical protein